jgi:carboxymethylenebutenolidase
LRPAYLAAAILDAFTPNLNAQQVSPDDKRITAEYVSYPSPKGHEGMKGYLARPANPSGRLPGVIVIHGAAGPEKHFEDVTRRLALADFVAFMVDAVSPLGGWADPVGPEQPGKGQQMMSQLDAEGPRIYRAVSFLKTHPLPARVGVVGFCWGGRRTLAVQVPDLDAAVPCRRTAVRR